MGHQTDCVMKEGTRFYLVMTGKMISRCNKYLDIINKKNRHESARSRMIFCKLTC